MRSRSLPSWLIALVVATAGLIAGCEPGSCTRHSDCPAHLVCGDDGRCVTPPPTSPQSDGDGGGDSDGGAVDAAPSD
jgi:hypothetical protein